MRLLDRPVPAADVLSTCGLACPHAPWSISHVTWHQVGSTTTAGTGRVGRPKKSGDRLPKCALSPPPHGTRRPSSRVGCPHRHTHYIPWSWQCFTQSTHSVRVHRPPQLVDVRAGATAVCSSHFDYNIHRNIVYHYVIP